MKFKTKIVSIVLFLITLFIYVSLGGQKAEWKGIIETEGGIKIIKNPETPLYGDINFELEEDLSIGNEEDENYLFYRTYYLAVDKQGNIYVVDRGNTRIQVFDKEGHYLRTIGRKGQGPGEFMSPSRVFINELNEEIYVIDFRDIKVFASNGDYLRNIPLKQFKGYYLYKSTFAVQPQLIKNGFIYFVDSSDEAGNIRIKRFKIKNWGSLKQK